VNCRLKKIHLPGESNMSTKKEDKLLDHNYDGIRELDNDLPPWWLYLFYFTIAFAVVYMVHYHVTKSGPSQVEEYMLSMNNTKTEKAGIGYRSPYYGNNDAINQPAVIDAENVPGEATTDVPEIPAVEVLTDEASLSAGKSVFIANCVACHGANGEGLIGPNMTDQYWIHGGNVNDLIRTINIGVPAKGMIPWDKTLSAEQIHQVASYILTLQGTNPPNAKAPEGTLYTGG